MVRSTVVFACVPSRLLSSMGVHVFLLYRVAPGAIRFLFRSEHRKLWLVVCAFYIRDVAIYMLSYKKHQKVGNILILEELLC